MPGRLRFTRNPTSGSAMSGEAAHLNDLELIYPTATPSSCGCSRATSTCQLTSRAEDPPLKLEAEAGSG
jgi:hypothetical protein